MMPYNFTLEKLKPFSWSYSRLKNYRICPSRHYHYDILKDISQPKSLELDEGNRIHAAFQRRVEKDTPMPTAYQDLDDWGNDAAKTIHPKQKIYCEYQIAVTRDGQPCDWFAKEAWFRTKIDLLKILPWKDQKAALIIDYKTGVPKDEVIQLALYAYVVFQLFPSVMAARTEYWWTKVKDKTVELFTREDMPGLWDALLPELTAMEQAYKNVNYPVRRNGLCKDYCDVTTCEHYKGK